MPDNFRALPLSHQFVSTSTDALDLVDITNSLRSLMVRQMGVIREAGGLKEAAEAVTFWRQYVLDREFASIKGWELQNMLLVAQCMIRSAREREESRGVHYRSDFPERDDQHWQRHLMRTRTE
jgi:L-aspartate oxidase